MTMGLKKYVLKPLLASTLMGIAAYGTYLGIYKVTSINIAALSLAIGIAVVVYVVSILKLSILNRSEIEQLPMGTKLATTLTNLKIVKD